MKRNRAIKIGSAELAAALVMASMNGLTLHRARAADSTAMSFTQQVLVVDKSDGAHTSGVYTPDLRITYRLTPVVGVTSNDSRYAETLASFPKGTLEDGTGVIEKSQDFTSGTTNASGVVSYSVPIGNIFADDQAKFVENSKVYRYTIAIVGVYLQKNDGTWSTENILNSSDSGIEVPTTVPLMDVNVDTDGKISGYARPQQFLTARKLDASFPRSPLRKTRQEPVSVNKRSDGLWMVDFGKAAYGQLELTIESASNDTLTIRLGEAEQGGRVNQKPGGSIRFTQYSLPVHKGRADTYRSEVIAGPDFIAATLRQCYFLFREEGCGIYAGIGSLEHYLARIIDRDDAVIVLYAGVAVLGRLHKILPVKGALDSLNYFFITLIYSVHLHHISTVFP